MRRFGITHESFWRDGWVVLARCLPAYYGAEVRRFGMTYESFWLRPWVVLVPSLCCFGKPIQIYSKPKLYFILSACPNTRIRHPYAAVPLPIYSISYYTPACTRISPGSAHEHYLPVRFNRCSVRCFFNSISVRFAARSARCSWNLLSVFRLQCLH